MSQLSLLIIFCLSQQTEADNSLPEAQSLRVENKIFYFDIGQNRRGTFMRISEVRWKTSSGILMIYLQIVEKLLSKKVYIYMYNRYLCIF